MRRALACLYLAFSVTMSGPAVAVEPDEVLSDPALEVRARTLSAELRCMVCQNQSIDDSNAPLARDLRILLRERIAAGDSDEEVIDFLVVRYGEFILLKPRFHPNTLLLWLAPPAVLIIGGSVAFSLFRRRRPAANAKPLDAAEKQRLEAIVGGEERPGQAPNITEV
jgi:cytochrome c-type biogenesis protein CcmH